jgi:hypothetical protein
VTEQYIGWALAVGGVLGGALVWFILGRLPRRTEDVGPAERREEALWIARVIESRGGVAPPALVDEVLELHGDYLAGPPLDVRPEPPAPADRALSDERAMVEGEPLAEDEPMATDDPTADERMAADEPMAGDEPVAAGETFPDDDADAKPAVAVSADRDGVAAAELEPRRRASELADENRDPV